MAESDSDDTTHYEDAVDVSEDSDFGDIGFLSEDTDSGLGISRWINEARRRERRKKRYTAPRVRGPPTERYIRQPDVVLHPAPGQPIPEFPLEKTLQRYSSLEAAFNHLNSLALTLGFALTKGPSQPRANGYLYKKFHCNWGPTRARGLSAATYAGESRCRWYISVSNTAEDSWFAIARASGAGHTHPALDPEGMSGMLRMYLQMNDTWIRSLAELGRPTRNVFDHLFTHNVPHDERSVYNRFLKHKREINHNLLPSIAALERAERNGDIAVPWIDHLSGRLEGILFTTKLNRALSHRFPLVFMVDITFSTNHYNLPCLHIVGKTNLNKTFTSAVVLLPNKFESTYREAIQAWKDHVMLSTVPGLFLTDREPGLTNALRAEFPEVFIHFCQWHATRNVQTHTSDAGQLRKKEITEFVDAWKKGILWCASVGQLEFEFDKLKNEFFGRTHRVGFRGAFDYVHNDLARDKEQLYDCYINRRAHLGHKTTSPGEGTHATLKKYMNREKPGLYKFLEAARTFMNRQSHAWTLGMAKHANKASARRTEHLRHFDMKVSRYALKLLEKSVKKLVKDAQGVYTVEGPCSQYMQRVMLLPCAHEIARRLNDGSWLRYEFHAHWQVTSAYAMAQIERRCSAFDTRLRRNARERLTHVDLPPVILEPTVRPAARLEYRNQRLANRFNPVSTSSARQRTAAEMAEIAVAERDDDVETLESFNASVRRANEAAAEEAVMRQVRQRAQRKCSQCRSPSHDKRNCSVMHRPCRDDQGRKAPPPTTPAGARGRRPRGTTGPHREPGEAHRDT